MKQIFLIAITATGIIFTAENENQPGSSQQMFGNIITDQVLIKNQDVHVHPKRKPHEDSEKNFKQKFSETLSDGMWHGLQSIPAMLIQMSVTAGAQLTVQYVNSLINKPSEEEQKISSRLIAIAKLKNELEIGSALQETLEQLRQKNPDNEKITQALEKTREKNAVLLNQFADSIGEYSKA